MSKIFLTIITILACLSSTPLAVGQDKPAVAPPELTTMREEHLRSMQRAIVPALLAYGRQLQLQKEFFKRQGKLDAALSVDKELKEIAAQLEVAKATTTRTDVSMQLAIVSASYGHVPSNRTVDTTKILRKALESGDPGITLGHKDLAGGNDPAPLSPKENTIVYSVNGQRKEKRFPESYKLNFKEDLK